MTPLSLVSSANYSLYTFHLSYFNMDGVLICNDTKFPLTFPSGPKHRQHIHRPWCIARTLLSATKDIPNSINVLTVIHRTLRRRREVHRPYGTWSFTNVLAVDGMNINHSLHIQMDKANTACIAFMITKFSDIYENLQHHFSTLRLMANQYSFVLRNNMSKIYMFITLSVTVLHLILNVKACTWASRQKFISFLKQKKRRYSKSAVVYVADI